jgi:hypothetical protein
MSTIDFAATKENMELINKKAFIRKMLRIHPDHPEVTPEVLLLLLSEKYPTTSPKALQVIGYLREFGFLVEHEAVPDTSMAA